MDPGWESCLYTAPFQMPLGMLFRFILGSCTAVKSALMLLANLSSSLAVRCIDRMLIVSIFSRSLLLIDFLMCVSISLVEFGTYLAVHARGPCSVSRPISAFK